MTKTLTEIIRSMDLRALEALCLKLRTYAAIRALAVEEGVDLDDLEEMLGAI